MQHSLFRQRQKRLCVFLENKSPTAYFFPHVARKNILFIWRQGPAEGLAAEAVAGAAGVVPGRFGAGDTARENQHWSKQGDKTHHFLLQPGKLSLWVWLCQLIQLLVHLLERRKKGEKAFQSFQK